MTLPDEVADRLRELVEFEPRPDDAKRHRRRPSTRRRKQIGKLVAAIIVLASIAMSGVLLWSALVGEPGTSIITAQSPTAVSTTNTPARATVENIPEASNTTTSSDAYRELRYLPAGSESGLVLQSIYRLPDTSPLAAFTRTTADGVVTGLVFVDRSDQDFATGVGVADPTQVEIDGQPALLMSTGPVLSNVIDWEDPELGSLRAWGLGTSAQRHVEIVDQLIRWLTEPTEPLPDGWEPLDAYEPLSQRDLWRAYYVDQDPLQVAVVLTGASPGPLTTCIDAPEFVCPFVDSRIDDDGIEITTIGSSDSVHAIASSLWPVTQNNRLIRANEFEPQHEVALDLAQRLLFVPGQNSEWQVVNTFAHSSGRSISEPALVLIERDAPEIGLITSAVVVNVLPDGTTEPAVEDVAEEVGPDRFRLVVQRDAELVEVIGWNYDIDELRQVARLVTITGEGVQFASRAAASVGLERRFEAIYTTRFPRRILEGTVFAATVIDDDGNEVVVRVSAVPGYEPAAVAVGEHENERVEIVVRGHKASSVVLDGQRWVRWEESPGILVSLNGPTEADFVQLAKSLAAVDAADLIATASE